jgi:signal peptidase II
VLDLLSKRAVVASLVPDERRTLIPGLLDLHFVRNVHGAMGLFGNRPFLLVSFALVVVAVLAFLLRSIVRRSPLAQIGFGLMLGGAFGNIVDRSLHQYVVDFISPRGFFVFNLGDACISLGLGCVALAAWRLPATAEAR